MKRKQRTHLFLWSMTLDWISDHHYHKTLPISRHTLKFCLSKRTQPHFWPTYGCLIACATNRNFFNFWLRLSANSVEILVLGPPPVYQDLSTWHYKPVKKAMVNLLIRLKGNSKCISSNLLQCTKKVVSDSPGLVDFAIGLVKSVPNLPDGPVNFFFWRGGGVGGSG